MFRKITIIFLVAMCLTMGSLTGQTFAQKDYTFGYVVNSLRYEFMVDVTNYMKDEAAKQGVNLIALDAMEEDEKQVSAVEDLVAKKVDMIIITAVSEQGGKAAIEVANKAGIPIMTCNNTAEGKKVTFVGSDDRHAGTIEGTFLVMKLQGEGKVVYLQGTAADTCSTKRGAGFRKVIADYPGIDIVADFYCHMSRAQAMATMEDILVRHPKGSLDAVVCQNDQMLMGSLHAIEAAGRRDEFKCLIGVDAIPDAVEAVREGRLSATVLQDAEGQGRGAIRLALRYLRGEKLPEWVETPFRLIWGPTIDKYFPKE